MALSIITVSGETLGKYLPDLARLRIQIFREYPYLYDGSEGYEKRYLQTYIASGTAVAVVAFNGEKIIGASTAVPMAHETAQFKQPFIDNNIDPETLFYCGESVLLPEYRGRGIYKTFFAERENHARGLGTFTSIGFCGVVRPEDHPRRPLDYQPLDDVWRHFGYQPRPDLIATFPWREVGGTEEIPHSMMFWLKSL